MADRNPDNATPETLAMIGGILETDPAGNLLTGHALREESRLINTVIRVGIQSTTHTATTTAICACWKSGIKTPLAQFS